MLPNAFYLHINWPCTNNRRVPAARCSSTKSARFPYLLPFLLPTDKGRREFHQGRSVNIKWACTNVCCLLNMRTRRRSRNNQNIEHYSRAIISVFCLHRRRRKQTQSNSRMFNFGHQCSANDCLEKLVFKASNMSNGTLSCRLIMTQYYYVGLHRPMWHDY